MTQIPVNIISKVEIPVITQETIATLITESILKANPEIAITDITFERKLNPLRVEAVVSARLKSSLVPEELVEEIANAKAPATEDTFTETEEPVETNIGVTEDEAVEVAETMESLFSEV